MHEIPYPVSITSCRDGSRQEAEVIRLTRELASSAIKARWWADPGLTLQEASREGDYHWDWVDHVGGLRARPFARAVAIRTTDGNLQAAMTYRVNGRSCLTPGDRAIFGDRLAAAPWNRDGLVSVPLYRGAGTALMVHAVADGHTLGLGGRMTLLSLPTPATRQFYERLGFQETGVEAGGMIQYELVPERATILLRDHGRL